MTDVRAATTANAASGTAISLTAPPFIPGDSGLVLISLNGTITCADNNGATPFAEWAPGDFQNATGGSTMVGYTRRLAAGDPTTWAFTSSASGRWGAVATVFTNSDPLTLYDVVATAATHDGVTTFAPAITTVSPRAIHVGVILLDSGGQLYTSFPVGYGNVVVDARTVGANNSQPICVSFKTIPGASSTGANVRWSGGDPGIVASLAIAGSPLTPGGGDFLRRRI